MAIEKKWEQIPPVAFSANGTVDGLVTIPSTKGFKTKQKVNLKSNTQTQVLLEIKRVLSKTQLLVGPTEQKLTVVSDISGYLTADSATIDAPEQPRPSIPLQEHERAVYEEEPVVAKRVFIVDDWGEPYDSDNPLPVEATISDNAPQNLFVYRRAYITAGVEASQLIPSNTKKLFVSIAGKNGVMRTSFTSGGTNDPSGDYVTTETGNSYDREGLKLIGKTLYYQANKDNVIIEIEAWV